MNKVALVFVLAVLLPSLVLAWLAFRSLRDQQFLLERQQSLLDQRATDLLAQNISDFLAQRQQEFSAQVESLAANQDARTVAVQFDNQIRQRWPLAEVGFCVTLSGKILSPPPNARPEAQMFRLDNSDFLGNLEAVEVYWNANPTRSGVENFNRAGQNQSSALNSFPSSNFGGVGGGGDNKLNNSSRNSTVGGMAENGSVASARESNTPVPITQKQSQQMVAFNSPATPPSQEKMAPAGSDARTPQRQQTLALAKEMNSLAPAAAPQLQQETALDGAAVKQPQEKLAFDGTAKKDASGQSQAQSSFNYKTAQSRKVSPQSQAFQVSDKAEAVSDEQKNLSRVIPAEAEFRQLIGNQADGILARFLQNKLKLMFWHRLSAEPDLIFGAQLNLNRVVDGLRGLIQPDPALQNEICLALLDDNARPVAMSRANFQASWKRPFVATEIGDALPHWEVAAYLVNPAQLTQAAHTVRLTLGLLIAVLVLAIGVGSWLIVSSLNAELKLARQKTDFVSNVSHELKTPLTSIRMFSELLADGRVADHAKRRSYLNIITAEAARLTRLINNVLDFSRMERGEKKYNFQPCDLVGVVRGIEQAFRPHLEAGGFKFICELPDAPIPVRGDADALSQVIVNLLSNAEKYSNGSVTTPSPRESGERAGVRGEKTDFLTPTLSSGGGGEGEKLQKEITLQLAQKPSPLPHAEIKVLDRGAGIPRDSEEKIFEKFYRAHDSLGSGVQGSGLGLTIARQIARAHGGDVVYEPREGGGSCFVLRLPIQTTDEHG